MTTRSRNAEFTPTHLLISRSKTTPVQLMKRQQGYALLTETEWQQGKQPAFELRPKLGIYCQGMPVIGYQLQPLTAAAAPAAAMATAPAAHWQRS